MYAKTEVKLYPYTNLVRRSMLPVSHVNTNPKEMTSRFVYLFKYPSIICILRRLKLRTRKHAQEVFILLIT